MGCYNNFDGYGCGPYQGYRRSRYGEFGPRGPYGGRGPYGPFTPYGPCGRGPCRDYPPYPRRDNFFGFPRIF